MIRIIEWTNTVWTKIVTYNKCSDGSLKWVRTDLVRTKSL